MLRPWRPMPPCGRSCAATLARAIARCWSGWPISVLRHVLGGRFCADWPHFKLDRHSPSPFEQERSFDPFAIDVWAFQAHEHQMIAAGGKRDGLAGLNLDPSFDRVHPANATLVRRDMNLDPISP